MPARSYSENRCGRCQMYQPLCLCPEIPSIRLETKIIALMHCRELKLTSNTARLACLALPNSEVHVRGEKDHVLDAQKLISEVGQTAILYPTDDSVELNSATLAGLTRPLTLIIPDGTWRQARKVAMRESALKGLLRLRLPLGLPSTYRLRFTPHESRLSTFEAISRTLGLLEGAHVQGELDLLFLKKVERMMWSRGKLPPHKCITKIPEAAFIAAHLAGMAGMPGEKKPVS